MGVYVGMCIAALIIVFVVDQYYSFRKLNNIVIEAFSDLDIHLKKRWDIMPELLSILKNYMKNEKDIIEEVYKIRSSSYDRMSSLHKIDINKNLSNGLSKIMDKVDNYPDLKANQNFSDIAKQLSEIEKGIADSKSYYNEVVRNLNKKIERFPCSIVAEIFNFKLQKWF